MQTDGSVCYKKKLCYFIYNNGLPLDQTIKTLLYWPSAILIHDTSYENWLYVLTVTGHPRNKVKKLLYTFGGNGYPQNNLILLHRLTATGYPQRKLKTLLYRLITMGHPRKKENNVVHIGTSINKL